MKKNYGTNFLNEMDIVIFEINNEKTLNANSILALFLIYTFRFISKDLYRDLVFFVICFREMVNSNGWGKLSFDSEDEESSVKEKEFCEENNTEIFPDFSNFFTKDFFCECLEEGNLIKDRS